MNFTPVSTASEIVEEFIKDHKVLQGVLDKLTKEQQTAVVFDSWTVKDIVAHLSAWNIECTKEIDRILQNKATWPGNYENEIQEAEFNQHEIEKRKDKSWEEVISEMEQTFKELIDKISRLTNEELNHQSGTDMWNNGMPVTVYSLFSYDYEEKDHESGHAEQIIKKFKL